jgi:hypothetical protein
MKTIVLHGINFDTNLGGPAAIYYLGKLLFEKGVDVYIYDVHFKENPFFNRRYSSNTIIDKENTVVLYTECIPGNPLNSKYIIRWLGAPIGTFTNGNLDIINTWNHDDIVYHFNRDINFNKHPEYSGKIYKNLSLIVLYDIFKNHNIEKKYEYCVTLRKSYMHKKIDYIHSGFVIEILRSHSLKECVEIFNLCKYFISYDPLTFLYIIAPICGCIPIVYPMDGLNKLQWLKTISIYEYLQENNLTNIYGVAYGNSEEEIKWATDTLHLVKEQWEDIKIYYENKYINQFIQDISIIEKKELLNTVKNNFYNFFNLNLENII